MSDTAKEVLAVQEAQRSLIEILEKEDQLAKKLAALEEKCRLRKWLLDGSAEAIAVELLGLAGDQKRLTEKCGDILGKAEGLEQTAEHLDGALQNLQASAKTERLVRQFCALESTDQSFSGLLAQRQEDLQALVSQGADEEEIQRWTTACQLLLDHLEGADASHIQVLMDALNDTLGAQFLAGIYGRWLVLPEDWEKNTSTLTAVHPKAAPIPAVQKPAEKPPAKPTVPEPPPPPERDPLISFEGPKRSNEPSSKKMNDLLGRGAMAAIASHMQEYVISSEAMMNHGAPDWAGPIASAVREGYLTKITCQGGTFYQLSPKFCAGAKKQSVQPTLRRKALLSLRAFPEEQITAKMLEHVSLVQGALLLLYNDKRLNSWNAERVDADTKAGCYRLRVKFTPGKNHYLKAPLYRAVAALEGLGDLADIRALLTASDPVWVVTPRREDIPAWINRLKDRELPMPEWIALDTQGEYFLPDGSPRSLLELFPPKGAPAPAVPAEEKQAPPPDPPREKAQPVRKEQKTPPPSPASKAEVKPQPSMPPEPPDAEEEPPRPSRPRSELFDLGKPEINLPEQAAQWAVAEKFPLALCLLRSAVEYDPALTGVQKQLAYALDDPMEACEYLDNRLSDVYAAPCEGDWGDPAAFQDLRVSAYLRMSLSSTVGQDFFQTADSLQGFVGNDVLPSLRQAFRLLSQFIREQRRGMDRQIIRQIHHQGDVSARLDELAKAAAEIRGRKWNEINMKMNRIKALFDLLFGSQSELMERLKIIASNDAAKREMVLSFCEKNHLLNAGGGPDPNGISSYIDHGWQVVPVKWEKSSPLTGKARKQALNRMSSCMDICAQWLEQTGGGTLKDDPDVERQHNQLIDCLTKAQKELEEQKADAISIYRQGAKAVLGQTLRELLDILRGENPSREFYYAQFLRTGYIELDDDFWPVLDEVKYMIPGYEPWQRLYLHDQAMIKSPGLSWDAAVERILGSDESQPDFRNFGSAWLIRRLCELQGGMPARLADARLKEDDRKTKAKVAEMEAHFRAELELAAAYGQIEDNTHKERLVTAITEYQREHFGESGNWGCYFSMMRACLEAVRKNAERLEPRYRYEFDQLKQSTLPCPIFDDIERLLNGKMFSVAHDYMQLVIKEHITQTPEGHMLQQPKEEDNLLRFLSAYNSLQRRSAERGDKETLYSLFKSLSSGEAGEDAERLLKAWPQDGQADPAQLKTLFQALAFPAARVEVRKNGLFRVEMNASTANVFSYPHPIAAFGTELFPSPEREKDSGLDVYILNGRKTVEELELKINGLGLNSRPTIFLLNYSIPLADRRELARKLKQGSSHPSTAIVADRVLMLFLARYPQAERARVLLQCTMPFHAYNPYTEGNTPPEMFMGRDAQLEDILHNGQANIIYGGRQLGKTALLRRAASLVDDRPNGRWAIYTDKMCRLDYEAALDEVYKCLCQNGFLERAAPPQDWGELCERIQARMDKSGDRVDRFLLLLDEADRFLDTSSELRYRPVECLYQLETTTGSRFKFVLAGLHSVMRFSREGTKGNSVLGKLSSRTIKPLTFPEASQLLELPLYYLGFRMKPEQNVLLSQILLSTNYYPGLIQFYCRQLVDSLKTRRPSEEPMPPYQLDEGTIRNLLQKEDFVEQIRDKFFITLDVEEDKLYYRALAYALAYCYYDASEDSVEGYTFEQIREVYEGFEIQSLCQLEPKSVKMLLSEMEDLNVLIQMDGRYSFNGANFRHMMGDEETIMTELDRLNRLGGEAR